MEDLFEKNFDELPKELVEVLEKHLYDDFTYVNCENLVNALNSIGYTCEYGLSAEPFGLRKLTEYDNLNDMEMDKLKVGDEVIWRGSWGNDLPKEVKVTCIEVNDINVSSIEWVNTGNRNVVVDLDNGHWAYGFQISKKN